MENLNVIIESLREEMTETLARWINIPSVKAEPAPGAPFGAEVRRSLDVALEDAQKLGFDTCIVPYVCMEECRKNSKIKVLGVKTVQDAIDYLM